MWYLIVSIPDLCPLPYVYVHVAVFQTFLRHIDPDDDIPYIYGINTSNQILRAGGDIYERNTCNFCQNCLTTYCTRHREFQWGHFVYESCIVLFQIINLGKVYKS